MKLTFLDWSVVAAYFLINLAIGLYYRKKASQSTGDFFVSGREVTWWLAGTSMVATTFAADTPLAVTGLVAKQGIAGNWLWWSLLFNGMMTVFFFARLWRRAEIITDAELVEIRYGGKPAAFLRGFRSVYFGIFMNCLVVGWVNLAMEKILMTALGISRTWALVICLAVMALTSFYTTISGLWGVLWTDVVQFVLKMGMVIVLAYYGVRAAGGMEVLKTKLAAVDAARGAAEGGSGSILSFIPDLHSPWMPIMAFCVYLGVNWWANWYPGAEPGGGGYVAQRIFCAKNEKHSLWATLWFNIAHYALRPWPWILTALASVVLYPNLADPEVGYVKVWTDHLPAALRGFMLAAFAAAYMSTIATQLNWGSSYIVNDFYRRFLMREKPQEDLVTSPLWIGALKLLLSRFTTCLFAVVGGVYLTYLAIGIGINFGIRGMGTLVFCSGGLLGLIPAWIVNRTGLSLLQAKKDEKHYVFASKFATAFLALLGAGVSLIMVSVSGAWQFILQIGAGTGAVYLLRWYWWRINAWSEISAMIAAAVTTILLRTVFPITGSEGQVFAISILLTVAITSVVWLAVTFLTKPEPESKLLAFYRRVRPSVLGWKHIAALAPEVPASRDGWNNLLDWLLGCLMVYMALFGIGKLLLGSTGVGLIFLAISALSAYAIYWDFSRRGWETLAGRD